MKLQNELAGVGYVEDIYGDLDYQLVVVEYGDDVYKFYWKIEDSPTGLLVGCFDEALWRPRHINCWSN